jgi:NNP family nitrate/nitrite transporter-like MFS transporter
MEASTDLQETDVHRAEKSDGLISHLSPLLILTSIFFINFIARIILAPLMPKIEKELSIAHTEAGSLFLLISIGYFITLLGSGFFSSRLTHRKTIILSSAVLGVALLGTSFSSGLWGLRIEMLILGMAAGLYLPSGIATLTATISWRHWGKAIAIHELAPNLSFVAAPLISEAILIWYPWRAVFIALGISALIFALIFARFGRGGEFHGQAPSYSSFRDILSKPVFWILVVLFSLGISSTLGLYTMLPLYLVTEHGMERNWANTLLALSRVVGVGMALIGGWVTDRIGPKRILMIVFLLTGLMTMFIGLASTSWIAVSVFIQPLLAVCFFPAGLAALSLVSSEKERNIVVSLTVPIAILIGGGAVPTLIGFIGDISTFAWGIVLIGGLILTGTIFTGYLQLSNPTKAPEI